MQRIWSFVGKMKAISQIKMQSGAIMPPVGFGTWQATDEELENALDLALTAGYRHIDTARAYDNEAAIGRVLKRWIETKKVTREELFIVTKLPPGGNHPHLVKQFMEESRRLLQLDYIDLYLVHTPFGFKYVENDMHPVDAEGRALFDKSTDHVAIWKKMENLVDSGLVKDIGVSNFNKHQIEKLLKSARIPPSVLQVELHVMLQQKDLVQYCKEKGIALTAYSPLGSRGLLDLYKNIGISREYPDIMNHPVVLSVAKRLEKTPAQVLLNFTLQRGISVIPKSTNPTRLKQNLNVLDFEINEADLEMLNALDRGEEGRICDFSFFKGITEHPEFPF